MIDIAGTLVSQPYVAMTLEVMKAFGVEVHAKAGLKGFKIARTGYRGRTYAIEPDASAASYFWAAAAITEGRVRVDGLSRASLQGDVAFCHCLEKMGCQVDYAADSVTVQGRPLRGIDVDMNGISDTVQTLAAVATFCRRVPTNIRGVGHIRSTRKPTASALLVTERLTSCRIGGRRSTSGPTGCARCTRPETHAEP